MLIGYLRQYKKVLLAVVKIAKPTKSMERMSLYLLSESSA